MYRYGPYDSQARYPYDYYEKPERFNSFKSSDYSRKNSYLEDLEDENYQPNRGKHAHGKAYAYKNAVEYKYVKKEKGK